MNDYAKAEDTRSFLRISLSDTLKSSIFCFSPLIWASLLFFILYFLYFCVDLKGLAWYFLYFCVDLKGLVRYFLYFRVDLNGLARYFLYFRVDLERLIDLNGLVR